MGASRLPASQESLPGGLPPTYVLICRLATVGLVVLSLDAMAGDTGLGQGYSGSVWIPSWPRGEMVRLAIDGSNRRATTIRGFAPDSLLEPSVGGRHAWATKHSVFGDLVRIEPLEQAISPVQGVPPAESLAAATQGGVWALDSDAETLYLVSSSGVALRKLRTRPGPTVVVTGEDGGVWVGSQTGISNLQASGELNTFIELGQPVAQLSASPGDGGVWALLADPLTVVRLSPSMQVTYRKPAPGAIALAVSRPADGCWVAMPDRVAHIGVDDRVDARVVGYEDLVWMTPNRADGSTWVLDRGGNRVSKLPIDENEAVLAIEGFVDGAETGLRMARQVTIRILDADPPPAAAPHAVSPGDTDPQTPPTAVKPPQDRSPVLPDSPTAAAGEDEANVAGAPQPAEAREEPPSPPEREGARAPESTSAAGAAEPSRAAGTVEPAEDSAAVHDPMLDPPARAPEAGPTPSPAPPEDAQAPKVPAAAPIPEAPAGSDPAPVVRPPLPPPERQPGLPQPIELPASAHAGVVYARLVEGVSTRRVKNSASVLGRRYVWNFDGASYTLLIGLDVETYNHYANRDRDSLEAIVKEGVTTMAPLRDEFQKYAKENGWYGDTMVSFVLAFAQSLPYTVDKVTTGFDEFIAYSYETLVSGGGDCEDTTILASAVLVGLGYEVVLLNPPGHLALGVAGDYAGSYVEHNGARYFYCESTGVGWRVGEVPDEYLGQPTRVIEIAGS